MLHNRLAQLSLVGLTLIATAYAEQGVSGSIRFDLNSSTQSTSNKPAELSVSRARLDFKGTVAKDFAYKIRLDKKDNTVSVTETKLTWTYAPYAIFNAGITTPSYCADDAHYSPQIESSIGVLSEGNGDKVGLNVSGIKNRFGYSLGAWKATSYPKISSITTYSPFKPAYDVERLRLGTGARVAFMLHDSNDLAWAVGSGVAAVNLIRPYLMLNSDGSLVTQVLTDRVSLTADTQLARGPMQLSSALHYINYYGEPFVNFNKNTAYPSSNYAYSGYVQVGYLLFSPGYKFDRLNGVVSSVILEPNRLALSLAARVGFEEFYNMAAYKYFDTNSMTLTTDTYYGLVKLLNADAATKDYVVRKTGYSLHANYHINKNLTLKSEYYDNTFKKNIYTDNFVTSGLESGIRLRAELNF